MSDRPVFVLPEGVEIVQGTSGIDLRYPGDIRIEGAPREPVGVVRSEEGTIEVAGKLRAHALHAPAIVIRGEVHVDILQAGEIRVEAGSLEARGCAAARRVELGPVRLAVDAIIAPEVSFHPEARGKVLVVESHNDLTPSAVQGRLRLSDLPAFTGQDPGRFLAERGLDALAPEAEEAVEELPPTAIEPPPDHEAPSTEAAFPGAAATLVPDEATEEAPHRPERAAGVAEPVSATPAADRAATQDDAVGRSLQEALDRILGCYEEEHEIPPPIARLEDLVRQRRIDAIGAQLADLWNDLLRFHQERALPFKQQVTPAFNAIHAVVRRARR